MADVEFEAFDAGFGAPSGAQGRLPGLFSLLGAASSIALVLGLGFWGYKLAVRDVNGVPVVRAIEGPMRTAPENPGGDIAAHTGLSVNAVTEDGSASAPADRLVLAPRPVELTLEDGPGNLVAQVAPVSGRIAQSPGLTIAAASAPAPLVTDSATEIEALVSAVVADAEALTATDASLALPVAQLPRGALVNSPRPQPRPDRLEQTVALTPAAATVAEIDPDTLTAGTQLVQLGAYDSEDVARKEWTRLAGKFGDLM
ncbi:MAG: SPOR domain-containing protein, partial [Paracoccaceae bacterium]|nr:SPOR domain-containing protein [Paracoccaceae bacterium]